MPRDGWMQHVHRALTEPDAEQYEFTASTAADGSLKVVQICLARVQRLRLVAQQLVTLHLLLQLTIQWRQGTYNASAVMTLPQSEDPNSMRAFLSCLYSSFTTLKESYLFCPAC